jgi:hypothetical protein
MEMLPQQNIGWRRFSPSPLTPELPAGIKQSNTFARFIESTSTLQIYVSIRKALT